MFTACNGCGGSSQRNATDSVKVDTAVVLNDSVAAINVEHVFATDRQIKKGRTRHRELSKPKASPFFFIGNQR